MSSHHQHLSPRLSTSPVRHGSLSPTSIPSSPTSVKSSSSAIFERDIEQIGSPTHTQHNPHRIPRAKTTTELSVPTVLDSAAAILADDTATADVDVELASRSANPSPRTSMLLASPVPSPPTPTSAYYSLQSSPAPTTRDLPPSSPSLSAHGPLSAHSKRLSFVSYSDLVSSAPVSTVPLAALTSGEASEPPHLMEQTGLQTPVHDEWEREGLGMGLEERLAALAASSPHTRPSSFISSF